MYDRARKSGQVRSGMGAPSAWATSSCMLSWLIRLLSPSPFPSSTCSLHAIGIISYHISLPLARWWQQWLTPFLSFNRHLALRAFGELDLLSQSPASPSECVANREA